MLIYDCFHSCHFCLLSGTTFLLTLESKNIFLVALSTHLLCGAIHRLPLVFYYGLFVNVNSSESQELSLKNAFCLHCCGAHSPSLDTVEPSFSFRVFVEIPLLKNVGHFVQAQFWEELVNALAIYKHFVQNYDIRYLIDYDIQDMALEDT